MYTEADKDTMKLMIVLWQDQCPLKMSGNTCTCGAWGEHYEGRADFESRATHSDTSYVMQRGMEWFDALHMHTLARHINHTDKDEERNVEVWEDDAEPTIVVRNHRPIQPGEEILMDYGDEYDSNVMNTPANQ